MDRQKDSNINGKMCNYNHHNCKIPVAFSSNKINLKRPPRIIPKKFSSTENKIENHMPSEHMKNVSEKLPGRFIKNPNSAIIREEPYSGLETGILNV